MALALVVFSGFARTFYLRNWFDVPPLTHPAGPARRPVHCVDGVFVTQTRLIATNNVRAHMRLGIAGVVLAALVFIVGVATAVVSASAPRTRAMGMASYQFVFVPLFIIWAFAGLVTAAVLLRKRSDYHKRLMTLAMITVLPPALARLIQPVRRRPALSRVADLARRGVRDLVRGIRLVQVPMLHPVYVIGGTLLVLSWPFRVWFARTPRLGIRRKVDGQPVELMANDADLR